MSVALETAGLVWHDVIPTAHDPVGDLDRLRETLPRSLKVIARRDDLPRREVLNGRNSVASDQRRGATSRQQQPSEPRRDTGKWKQIDPRG